MVHSGRTRRSQDERSSETRRRINEATIACLAEHGMNGTTVSTVTTQAGVSRGALAHHYRSKQDLLLAVGSAITHRVAGRFRNALAERAASEPVTVGEFGDLLWRSFSRELLAASIELWTAARTEPELWQAMSVAEDSLRQRIRSLTEHVDSGDAPYLERAVDFALLLRRSVPAAPPPGDGTDYPLGGKRQFVSAFAHVALTGFEPDGV